MRTRVIRAEEATVDVKFCLMFPREALSVPVMRRVLGDTLSRLGVDEDCIGELLLAVTEACTNVLQHGGPSHRYEVVASIGGSGCVVEVLDSCWHPWADCSSTGSAAASCRTTRTAGSRPW